MSWSIGYDSEKKRDIGHGVPAFCDHPGCGKKIDRGLEFVCADSQPYGGNGCGLYFCEEHLRFSSETLARCCERCAAWAEPFPATADHPEWIHHKLTHESWAQWRLENPAEVVQLRAQAGLPIRLTLSRKRGWKMPENTVKVDRSTKWGNPYKVDEFSNGAVGAVDAFRVLVESMPETLEDIRRELVGKNLACWCKQGDPCHADVLLNLANPLQATVVPGFEMREAPLKEGAVKVLCCNVCDAVLPNDQWREPCFVCGNLPEGKVPDSSTP